MRGVFYNVIDEKGRFVRLIYDADAVRDWDPPYQYDSHTFSYLYCRGIEKEIDPEPFGLELEVEE
jgi:hypothetical protein